MTKARSAASEALTLDARLAEPHATLAYRTTHYEWDWVTAEEQFKRALELNPNYAVTHHWYSHYLTAMGRTGEFLAANRRCLELDPLDLVINIHMAWHHHFSRQYEAAAEFQKAIKLSGSVTFTTAGLGFVYGMAGKKAQACAIFEALQSRSLKAYVPSYDLALVCCGPGWTDQVFHWLDKAYDERSGWLTYLKADPRLDVLRSHAQFGELLRRVHPAP